MPIQAIADIPPLLATSVVRGSEQGQSHGGVYLVDPRAQAVHQLLDWDRADIDWTGRGWDRGLRGIAFDGDTVYIAASDELFAYDREFRRTGSWRNPYLKHCHEIAVHRGVLYLTSTGFDSILAFDLARQHFTWGLYVARADGTWHGHRFDPAAADGPAAGNRLHINNVAVDDSGLSFSGLRTHGIVTLGAEARLHQQVELPAGVHNARLFRDGVLFNDTNADCLRFVSRSGDERHFRYPVYADEELEWTGVDDSNVARQGFGRGLCAIDERLVAAGSSPSTVSVFDIDSGTRVFSVNFSMDVRNAIHGLEVWPWPLPGRVAQSAEAASASTTDSGSAS
ncbi:MAG: hypothetical protein R3176_10465 [Woeseiaceae bacterium]|nr:hypothetical protein [Woeseiaceae bacterium]